MHLERNLTGCWKIREKMLICSKHWGLLFNVERIIVPSRALVANSALCAPTLKSANQRNTVLMFTPIALETESAVSPLRTALTACWRMTCRVWWSWARASEERVYLMRRIIAHIWLYLVAPKKSPSHWFHWIISVFRGIITPIFWSFPCGFLGVYGSSLMRGSDDFFHSRIDQTIDLRHPLAVLASHMPWRKFRQKNRSMFTESTSSGEFIPIYIANKIIHVVRSVFPYGVK